MKEKILTSLTLLALGLLALSCKNEPPPAVQVPALELVAEDASCTEAWLRIRSLQVPATVQLLRDGQRVSDLRLLTSDSLVVDEGLLPRRIYTYKAQLLEPCLSGRQAQSANLIASTPEVQVTTMDTTSHSFSFQIDTLGDGGGSVLYDVAIINDTLAYAVGEIYKRDSLGNWDPLPYNAARWNGRRWDLLRVPAYIQGSTWYLPIRCITAFSPDDIWFEAGIHWDGTRYNTVPYTINYPARINKSWGTSSRDFYVVGDGGLIAHYDGTRWRRIESGTTLPIMDIWGARKDQSGEYEILCVSADPNIPGQSKVLSIENMTVRELATDPMWEPWAIWFVPGRRYIHAGDGLWEAYRPSGPWVRNTQIPPLFKTCIDALGLNDTVVGGAFWLLAHWNGVSWHTYFPRTNGSFGSVALRQNLLVAVGYIGNTAAAVTARR